MQISISPFINDPCVRIAEIFKRTWPDKKYIAQLVPELKDENGAEVYVETVFPEDGSEPLINISVNIAASNIPEIFAHDLAHVAAGEDAGHGLDWGWAFDLIYTKYNAEIEQEENNDP